MERKLVYMIILIWMVTLGRFVMIYEVSHGDEMNDSWEQFQKLLGNYGADTFSCKVDLSARGQLGEEENYRMLLMDVARRLGVEEPIVFHKEIKQNGTCLYWIYEKEGVDIQAQYLNMEEDYVVLRMETKKKGMEGSFYRNVFEEIAQDYDLTGVPCMEFQAKIPEQLKFSQKNLLSEMIFYLFHAQEVDGIRGQDLYTVYGYSENVPISIITNAKKMNINLAFRSLEQDGTEVHLGIPVLKNNDL